MQVEQKINDSIFMSFCVNNRSQCLFCVENDQKKFDQLCSGKCDGYDYFKKTFIVRTRLCLKKTARNAFFVEKQKFNTKLQISCYYFHAFFNNSIYLYYARGDRRQSSYNPANRINKKIRQISCLRIPAATS